MAFPVKTPPGPVFSGSLDSMQAALAAAAIRGGSGMRLSSSGRGSLFSAPKPPPIRRWYRMGRDWKVSENSITGSTLKLDVYPSTVNQVIPSNWDSTASVDTTGTWYVMLDCSVSGGKVSSCSISTSTSAPTGPSVLAGTPPASFKILLAIVVDSTIWQVALQKPFIATPVEAYRAAKLTSTPGEYPMDIYYTWQVTQP